MCRGEKGSIVAGVQLYKTPYQMDIAVWCFKWVVGWVDWIYLRAGGRYRADYGANKTRRHTVVKQTSGQ